MGAALMGIGNAMGNELFAGVGLFAQGWQELIFALVFLAIIIFNVLGSLFSNGKKKPNQNQQGGPKQGDDLRREIEQFRKARQEREMAAGRDRSSQPRPRQQRPQPVAAETGRERPARPRKIAADGSEIRRRPDRNEKHRQEAFAHEEFPPAHDRPSPVVEAIPVEGIRDKGVVELPKDEGNYAFDREKEASVAEELFELFKSPASMRQAILFSEILHRPTHRW
jgi:hypothetical protein